MKRLLILICMSVFFVTSCKNEELDGPTVYKFPDTVRYDTSVKIKVTKNGKDIPSENFDWTVADSTVASIDRGMLKARKIGKTEFSFYKSGLGGVTGAILVVEPYFETYEEPILSFNQNKGSVVWGEKRSLFQQTDNFLLYSGENEKVKYVGYNFIDGKLNSVGVMFGFDQNIIPEVTTYLKERYPDNGTFNNRMVFLDDARRYGITLLMDPTYGLTAVYTAYKGDNSRLLEVDEAAFVVDLKAPF